MGNVHEVAQSIVPDVRVVYVDIDPIAITMSKDLLFGNPNVSAIEADIRDPEIILDHPVAQELINFKEPLALLMVSARFRDRLPSGSYMVMAHFSMENAAPELLPQTKATMDLYVKTKLPITSRTRAELAEFFTDMHILEPGIVYIAEW